MQLAPQQEQAAQAVKNWLKDKSGKQFFYLAGYAGTGKTTIARLLAESVNSVVFAAYTGKAALVLRTKGCLNASTIHALIYTLDDPTAANPTFVLNRESPIIDADLVIIDEVSMVGPDIGNDLLSFGKKVLVLGDPAQLPPVNGEGFFTSNEPDFMLTDVHRQAADNPIIHMSMIIREGGVLQPGRYGGSSVIFRNELEQKQVLDVDQVLVGRNMTRRAYNARLRKLMNFESPFFQVGDRVISLKNDKDKGLFNGGIWGVSKIVGQNDDETTMLVSPMDAGMTKQNVYVRTHHNWLNGTERELNWKVAKKYQPFDFAYAITCHKAQGSQWDDVMVFDESAAFQDTRSNWLYTAVTRAAVNVTVVV